MLAKLSGPLALVAALAQPVRADDVLDFAGMFSAACLSSEYDFGVSPLADPFRAGGKPVVYTFGFVREGGSAWDHGGEGDLYSAASVFQMEAGRVGECVLMRSGLKGDRLAEVLVEHLGAVPIDETVHRFVRSMSFEFRDDDLVWLILLDFPSPDDGGLLIATSRRLIE